MSDEPGEIVVDARGHRCPTPTLKLRKALANAPPGARLRLIANDPLARIDVPHFLAEIEAALVTVTQSGDEITFLIAKPGRLPQMDAARRSD